MARPTIPDRATVPPPVRGREPSAHLITRLVQDAGTGDAASAARLFPLVYDELRRIARTRMQRTPPGNTLTPTALVHEAYLKLVGSEGLPWESSRHFFLTASQAMRSILVDHARRKAALKHGGAQHHTSFDEDLPIAAPAEDVLALDDVLEELEREEPECAEIVTLHYFAGLSLHEVAAVKQLSHSTVRRRWRFARAWLQRALDEHGHERSADLGE